MRFFDKVSLKGLVIIDYGRVVEQMFRNSDLRVLEMEFDLKFAGLFNPRGVKVFAHQAEHGGADILVQPLVE